MSDHDQAPRANTYVLFRLGQEEYGLPIDTVQSIIRYEEPTPVPRSPEAVQGVINLRGRVIPVVDLTRRLFGTPFTAGPTSRIVVTEGEAGTLGLAVDAANEVVTITEDDIKPAPESVLSEETSDAFVGVADHSGRLIVLLNLDEAVPGSGYAQLAEAGQAGEEGSDV